MEALQLAQMLADLNDLQATQDQSASKSLVNAHKTLDENKETTGSQSAPAARNPLGARQNSATASRFDRLGRRIFTPPLTRTNSTTASSPVPGTPVGTPRHQDHDADIDRASTILSLCEIRAKLKEQDNNSRRAREKVDAILAKQARMASQRAANSAPRNN